MAMKYQELANPNSCLNKAKDDEWLFVLLGRDLSAPVAVRAWIEDRVKRHLNTRDDAKIREAEAWILHVTKEQTHETGNENNLRATEYRADSNRGRSEDA